MSMKLITAPPWIDPPMFIWSSVGNIRQMPRPGPSGLKSSRPVAAAKLERGKSPQLYQPSWSGSGVAPRGSPTSSIISLLSSLTRPVVSISRNPSSGSLRDQLLGLGNRLGRIETLGADVGTIHDRVAAIEPKRILERVEALAGRFVAAVGKPAVGLDQDCRPQKLVGVPPIARA